MLTRLATVLSCAVVSCAAQACTNSPTPTQVTQTFFQACAGGQMSDAEKLLDLVKPEDVPQLCRSMSCQAKAETLTRLTYGEEINFEIARVQVQGPGCSKQRTLRKTSQGWRLTPSATE